MVTLKAVLLAGSSGSFSSAYELKEMRGFPSTVLVDVCTMDTFIGPSCGMGRIAFMGMTWPAE